MKNIAAARWKPSRRRPAESAVLIMALDLATVTGYAIGRAGAAPRSGSVRLRAADQERGVAPFNLGCFLRDRFVLERPDLLAVEDMLNPTAHRSAAAVLDQIMLHGVVEFMARVNRITLRTVHRSTVLKHFTGSGKSRPRAVGKRDVIQRAQAFGLVPPNCRDEDRCDAVAVWDWACASTGVARLSRVGLPDDLSMGGVL